jgi:hypothetical protein
MKQTINSSDFIQSFHSYNRYDQFGYEALNILFEYFEEVNPDMELDVIAICCDYSHSDTLTIANDYSIDLSDCVEAEDRSDTVREWLNDNTTIIGETNTGFVYCSSF